MRGSRREAQRGAERVREQRTGITYPRVMSWYPKKQNAGSRVMKNVGVPSEDVFTKYASRKGVRTFR